MYYLQIAFGLSLFALCGTYFLYPAIFYLLHRIVKNGAGGHDYTPEVALITSFSNEEASVLKRTLDNRQELIYPNEKLTLVFVADSAPAALKEVINQGCRGSRQVVLHETSEHGGKTKALNEVIPSLTAEILVFSDANSLYRQNALKKLVRYFAEEKVGGVCGELQYVDEEIPDITGKMSGVYLKYEQFVKIAESRVSTLTVYNGAIYAIRKKLHQKMNTQAANDFQHPVQVVLQGYKSVYEPEAVAYEKAAKNDLIEFKRTARIIARGWKGLFTYPVILNPFKTGLFSIQFMFRKLFRWLGPFFMLLVLISSFALRDNLFFYGLFILQLLFYLVAIGGWLLRNRGFRKLFYYPYYFCLVNLAALLGFITFIKDKDTATWVPTVTK